MTTMLRVKNWDRLQHYRHRNPPWIKLYRSMLDDYAFTCLPDAARSHLIAIWLLASHSEGLVPADAHWIQRRIAASESVDLQALVDAGFLVEEEVASTSASMLLAERKQSASTTLAHDASTLLADCKQSAIAETEKKREEKRREEIKALVESEASTGTALVSSEPKAKAGIPQKLEAVIASLAAFKQGEEFAELARAGLAVEEASGVVVSLTFSYWAHVLKHPAALLDPKRAGLVRRRFLESRDPSEILFVVDGTLKDDHLMNRNGNGRKYDDICTIYRDREQVERLSTLGGYKPGLIHRAAKKYLGLNGEH